MTIPAHEHTGLSALHHYGVEWEQGRHVPERVSVWRFCSAAAAETWAQASSNHDLTTVRESKHVQAARQREQTGRYAFELIEPGVVRMRL